MSPSELTPIELMQKCADFFERLGVPYRIVGSMASMAYSEPRFTNDIDILADLREEHIDSFPQEFTEPDFDLSTAAIKEAVHLRGQFNIIHVPSGLKIDVIQRKDSEFGQLDITHGRRLKCEGFYDAWFGSPENVILMKLRYFHEGGSEKHLRDIASILLIQASAIDLAYLGQWAEKLGVLADWEVVIRRVQNSKE